jgi:hypothetical protein
VTAVRNPFKPVRGAPAPVEVHPAGLVYYLLAPSAGMVKIGTTTGLRSRLRSLATGSPEELVLLRVTTGGAAAEARAHARWAHLRRRLEWFAATPELLAFVRALPDARLAPRDRPSPAGDRGASPSGEPG